MPLRAAQVQPCSARRASGETQWVWREQGDCWTRSVHGSQLGPRAPLPSLTTSLPVGSVSISVSANPGSIKLVHKDETICCWPGQAGGCTDTKEGSGWVVQKRWLNKRGHQCGFDLVPGRVHENRLFIQLGRAAVFQFPINSPFPGPLLPHQLEAWPLWSLSGGWLSSWECGCVCQHWPGRTGTLVRASLACECWLSEGKSGVQR